MKIKAALLSMFLLSLFSCTGELSGDKEYEKAAIFTARVNGMSMTDKNTTKNQPVDDVVMTLEFSSEVDM